MHDVLPFGVQWSEGRLAFRCVEAPDLDLVESKFVRRLVHQPFHEHDALHAARLTLWPTRRRIREHAHPSPAHRRRLIEERNNQAGRGHIELLLVRTVVHDGKQIDGGQSSVFGKSDLHPAVDAGAGAADGVFLLAADTHHDRAVGFPGQKSRNDAGDRACDFAAESSPRIRADDDDVLRLHMEPSGDGVDRLDDTLRRAVDEHLAVLPVRHGRA